jgi:hypothetical protein
MFSWRRGRTRGDCTKAAGAARGSGSRYWLIAKNNNGLLEVLTINLEDQETIPIFSFREEAQTFIRFEPRDGWWVRETSAGELVSLLCGPYLLHVKSVALDPLPEICDEGMTHLVSVRRMDFALRLLGDRGTRVTSTPSRRAGGPRTPKEVRRWA